MKKNVVQGVITDGDARRGIKHYAKNITLKKFMTPNPLFISENASASKALSIMNKKRITSLLVTTDKDFDNDKRNKKLKGIIHIHNLLQYGIK